jgi:hypothetical protein
MVHVFRQLGMDDAAEWTTVIGHFSDTWNLILNCLTSTPRHRKFVLYYFNQNLNDHILFLQNTFNVLLIYSWSGGCFIKEFVTEILLICKLCQPELVTALTELLKRQHKYLTICLIC